MIYVQLQDKGENSKAKLPRLKEFQPEHEPDVVFI